MEWFYDLLNEKCNPVVLGQTPFGKGQFCSAAESETVFIIAAIIFTCFVVIGGTVLYGWKKWQNEQKEKK